MCILYNWVSNDMCIFLTLILCRHDCTMYLVIVLGLYNLLVIIFPPLAEFDAW